MLITLNEIIEKELGCRVEGGAFGIKACKESIQFEVDFLKKSLYELLESFVIKANETVFFNRRMILACWEMINAK